MTERLLSVSKNSKKRVITGVAVGLSVVALGACGKDTSKKDAGSDKINACPTGYVTKDQHPIKDRSAFSMAMGNAVTQLASKLSTNYYGKAEVLNDNTVYSEAGLVQRAAVEVFHVKDEGDFITDSPDYFEIDNNETRVDDLSEQFCNFKGETYEAAQAARAIGAMKAAHVDVSEFTRSQR